MSNIDPKALMRYTIVHEADSAEYIIMGKKLGFFSYFYPWKEYVRTNTMVDAMDVLKQCYEIESNIKSSKRFRYKTINCINIFFIFFVLPMIALLYANINYSHLFAVGYLAAQVCFMILIKLNFYDFFIPTIVLRRNDVQ